MLWLVSCFSSVLALICLMEAKQELLRKAWRDGRGNELPALSQARAWALREAWKEFKDTEYGMLKFIADKVDCTPSGISQLLQKIDSDAEWFPGKTARRTFGPPSVISATCQNAVAQSAMAKRKKGEEVTYESLVASNPNALCNPNTGEPVGKKRVYAILKERCYDDADDPEDTWGHHACWSKHALTESQMANRLQWAIAFKAEDRTAQWMFTYVVWTDICNSLIPTSEKRAMEMRLAVKGKKGWRSKKTKLQSKSLRGQHETIKQKGYGAVRVWWAPILTRGKLHIEFLGADFPGETPEGAAILVARVRAALNIRFQAAASAPKLLFTDRGQGFFIKNSGKITPEYKAALAEHSLKAYYGDDASVQPGKMGDVLLHETAVSWIRYRERRCRIAKPWEETMEEVVTRMKGIVQKINDDLDVEGLCRQFPRRVQELIDAEGDRLRY